MEVESLCRSYTPQRGFHWQHLHRWVTQETADLQTLPTEVAGTPPFSLLPPLATEIEDRLDRYFGPTAGGKKKEWLTVLGRELSRAEFGSDDDTRRIRAAARRLARTGLRYAPCLEIVPYLNGIPAGTARPSDAVWLDDVLYVEFLPPAKQARRVPEEIGKAFGRTDIEAALHYSFERSEKDVRDYMAENFNLSVAISKEDEVDLAKATQRVDAPEVRPAGRDGKSEHVCIGSADDEKETDTGLGGNEPQDIHGNEAADRLDEGTKAEQGQQPDAAAVRPVRVDIMERYAKTQGFRKENDKRFSHKDGGWIARADGTRFPWERYGADGELVRYYLPKEHCLEREPLQIEADVWRLMEKRPETYALIMIDIEGSPTEVTGSRLKAMQANRQIVLYPATYRLVFDESRVG